MKDFSVPVGLDAKVKVDLVVVGSVAVSEKGNLTILTNQYCISASALSCKSQDTNIDFTCVFRIVCYILLLYLIYSTSVSKTKA